METKIKKEIVDNIISEVLRKKAVELELLKETKVPTIYLQQIKQGQFNLEIDQELDIDKKVKRIDELEEEIDIITNIINELLK